MIEFIISCGAGGMFYSLFSGQPMTFVGPTGAYVPMTVEIIFQQQNMVEEE